MLRLCCQSVLPVNLKHCVGPGDAVYFMAGFRCTWHINEAPLVQRYGFFGFDGKEIKDAEITCDVCGCDCADESYLYDDEMDICPRCFKLDAESTQQYEDATQPTLGEASRMTDRKKVWEFPPATV